MTPDELDNLIEEGLDCEGLITDSANVRSIISINHLDISYVDKSFNRDSLALNDLDCSDSLEIVHKQQDTFIAPISPHRNNFLIYPNVNNN